LDLQYLQHHQIDKEKWDKAIENSHNSLLYALSWFLDTVAPNWEAVVLNDYEAVMPLTIKKKFGVKYVFKPFFAQFYGIFYTQSINEKVVEAFIRKALEKVQYIDVWFNPHNPLTESKTYIKRQTQELKLTDTYEELCKSYTRSTKNNLKKARKENLILRNEPNGEIELNLLRGMYQRKGVHGATEEDFINLKSVYDYSLICKEIETKFYTLYKDNEPCAAAFIIHWNKRAIIYHAANGAGRKARAMFILLDEYIKDHAGQDLTLDFAGSNIPGVAEWNLGFGAANLNYYAVRINNLPIPLKWFKK
jgi:hypothetical protein